MTRYNAFRALALPWFDRLGLAESAVPTKEVPDEGVFLHEAPDALEWVYTERGLWTVLGRGEPDQVVFLVLRSLTGAQAQAHEFANRRLGEDSRRQWMADHIRRMEELRPEWGEAVAEEYAAILVNHPFDDRLARRSERWHALIEGGMPRAEAVAQAEREIP